MSTINELDRVCLVKQTNRYPTLPLKSIGTVVYCYQIAEAYEVEFIGEDGNIFDTSFLEKEYLVYYPNTLAKLEIIETFSWYNMPVLFTAKDDHHTYLAIAHDFSQEENWDSYLFIPLSDETLENLRQKTLDMYTAIKQTPWVNISKIYGLTKEEKIEVVSSESLTDEDLPNKGEYLC